MQGFGNVVFVSRGVVGQKRRLVPLFLDSCLSALLRDSEVLPPPCEVNKRVSKL